MDINAVKEALSKDQIVCSGQCDQCLFSKNKIVGDQRAKEILKDCEQKQTHFICHKGSITGINLVCTGFYKNKTTPYLELMKVAGKIRFMDPMALEPEKREKGKRTSKRKKKDMR